LYLTKEQKLNNQGKELGEHRGTVQNRTEKLALTKAKEKMRKGDSKGKKQESNHD